MGKHVAQKSSRGSRRRDPGKPVAIEQVGVSSTSGESRGQYNRRTRRPTPPKRHPGRGKRVVLWSAAALVVVLLLAAGGAYVFLRDVANRMQTETADTSGISSALAGAPEKKPNDAFYMIIMGVDTREGETVARSDTLIVARIDPGEKAATLVSIPRDTRVAIPDHGTQKINAANALGGPALVIETVKAFTGLPIAHYMEVDFNGFKGIVDAMGGVTVTVPERINDMKAADHNAAAAVIEAGEQKLTGAQALTFVRSRDYPTGDFQRIANQQTFMKALLRQGLRLTNAFRVPKLLDAVADSVKTDLSITELYALANDMKGMSDEALMTVTMPGESKMIKGVSYVVADEAAFATIIDRVSKGLSPEPQPDEVAALPEPSTVSVTVRNGAGLAGVAADAASRLTSAGFAVGEVGNANQFVYDETLIVYIDDESLALAVQKALGAGKVVASRGMYSFSTDVLLVVGKDWKIGGAQGAQ